MSLPDPAMNLLNAEYNALLTPQARTRFLSSYTGMAADRVERIDQSGSPWPGTLERETREAEALGIELSRYLAGLAEIMEWDAVQLEQRTASIAAALDRGDPPESSPEFNAMRERIQRKTKERHLLRAAELCRPRLPSRPVRLGEQGRPAQKTTPRLRPSRPLHGHVNVRFRSVHQQSRRAERPPEKHA